MAYIYKIEYKQKIEKKSESKQKKPLRFSWNADANVILSPSKNLI